MTDLWVAGLPQLDNLFIEFVRDLHRVYARQFDYFVLEILHIHVVDRLFVADYFDLLKLPRLSIWSFINTKKSRTDSEL